MCIGEVSFLDKTSKKKKKKEELWFANLFLWGRKLFLKLSFVTQNELGKGEKAGSGKAISKEGMKARRGKRKHDY